MEGAVKALEKRLIEGNEALNDMEHEVCQTKELIKEIYFHKLKNEMPAVNDTTPKPLKNDVYNLCEDSLASAASTSTKHASQIPNVSFTGPWFKMFNSEVVIGCTISGDSERCLNSLSIDILINKSITRTIKIYEVRKKKEETARLHKRARMEFKRQLLRPFQQGAEKLDVGKKLSILTKILINSLEPDFGCTLSVILKYSFEMKDGSLQSYSQSSRSLNICSTDLFSKTNQLILDSVSSDEDSMEQALAVLHMSGEVVRVSLKSSLSQLLCIDQILSSLVNLQHHLLLGIWFWKEPPIPLLQTAWLEILNSPREFEVEIGLHAKDEDSLLLFVSHLYDCLPEDVVILPLTREANSSTQASQLLDSMLREVDFLSRKLDENKDKRTGCSRLEPEIRDSLDSLESETDNLAKTLMNTI